MLRRLSNVRRRVRHPGRPGAEQGACGLRGYFLRSGSKRLTRLGRASPLPAVVVSEPTIDVSPSSGPAYRVTPDRIFGSVTTQSARLSFR